MRQPATPLAAQPLDFELVFDDGDRSGPWRYHQTYLLTSLLFRLAKERQQSDVYIGGDEPLIYSAEQAQTVAAGRPLEFRGPDVFWIGGVDPKKEREGWVVWEEDGRYPDVIFELLSKSNKASYRRKKKDLYARVFRTPEYFLFGPKSWKLEGFRLAGGEYRPIPSDAQGRLWSEQVGCFVGLWHGIESGLEADWIRLYRPDGSLVPTAEETAKAERRRADAAEAELARLRALLAERS